MLLSNEQIFKDIEKLSTSEQQQKLIKAITLFNHTQKGFLYLTDITDYINQIINL